jgi:phospholipase/carboxylesterase
MPADAAGRTTPPTVIYLHGRGANETSVDVVRPAFDKVQLLAPRGRLAEGAGYAWFRNRAPGFADHASLRTEVLALEEAVDRSCPQSNLWLCGFSNGAAMAAALLLSRPHRYAGALLLSGPIVDEQPWPPQRLKGLPVLMMYGADDWLIPRALFHQTADYLQGSSGARATVAEVAGGHEISSTALQTMQHWLAGLLG